MPPAASLVCPGTGRSMVRRGEKSGLWHVRDQSPTQAHDFIRHVTQAPVELHDTMIGRTNLEIEFRATTILQACLDVMHERTTEARPPTLRRDGQVVDPAPVIQACKDSAMARPRQMTSPTYAVELRLRPALHLIVSRHALFGPADLQPVQGAKQDASPVAGRPRPRLRGKGKAHAGSTASLGHSLGPRFSTPPDSRARRACPAGRSAALPRSGATAPRGSRARRAARGRA